MQQGQTETFPWCITEKTLTKKSEYIKGMQDFTVTWVVTILTLRAHNLKVLFHPALLHNHIESFTQLNGCYIDWKISERGPIRMWFTSNWITVSSVFDKTTIWSCQWLPHKQGEQNPCQKRMADISNSFLIPFLSPPPIFQSLILSPLLLTVTLQYVALEKCK